MPYRLSLIIPAHDEEAVIERCLRSVMASTIADQVEVLVVCNGCTDATAEVARSVSSDIRVLELPVAAKYAALNLGDREATAANRAYLDADTILSPGALEAVAGLLERPEVLAASPEIRFDVDNCSWPARQFHRIWRQSPYFRGVTLGAGFYAISAEGRRRFESFPPVVGDDYLVAGHFRECERALAVGETFRPLLPTTLRSMLHVHVRHYGAHAELDEWLATQGHSPLPGHARSSFGWLASTLRQPGNWAGVPLFVGVKLISIAMARREHRTRGMSSWNRDQVGRRAARS
jgi:glycosyltransferase involved in cell wall biosynthesis